MHPSLGCVRLTWLEVRVSKFESTYVPIACVRFPALPMLAHHPELVAIPQKSPAVVHDQGQVVFCNREARQRGVRPGQTLQVARTRDASLVARPLSRSLLRQHQRRVLRRLVELSPRVSVSRLAVFWAEPFGSHWPNRVCDAFDQPVRVGLGPDATTAYAAACCTQSVLEVAPQEARTFLDRSPIAVLELRSSTRRALAALGIRRVGELRAFDPTSLAMRMGPEVAAAWHRAEGNDPRGPRFSRLRDPNEASLELDEPVSDHAALFAWIDPMVVQLVGRIRDRDHALVEVRLRLDPTDRGDAKRIKDSHTRARNRHASGHEVQIRFGSPVVSAEPLVRALHTKLEAGGQWGEVRHIALFATTVLSPRQTESLLGPTREGAQSTLLGRFRERLGSDAVRRPFPRDATHRLRSASWSKSDPQPPDSPRWPWRELPKPVPVRDRRVELGGRVRRVLNVGRAERVSRPWWDGQAFPSTVVCAWAEVEGPVLVLLRQTASGWELIGWLD